MPRPRLFHVSEEAGIARFEPRPNYRLPGEMVWAVDAAHLANFLTPRDCPRITFGRSPHTSEEDAARFLAGARRVVAFEAEWLERVRSSTLHVYELPAGTFEVEDAGAGYWLSRQAVTPIAVTVQSDLLRALAQARAEIRVLQTFWPLRDAVANSSLEFSIIHQDRARPRGESEAQAAEPQDELGDPDSAGPEGDA